MEKSNDSTNELIFNGSMSLIALLLALYSGAIAMYAKWQGLEEVGIAIPIFLGFLLFSACACATASFAYATKPNRSFLKFAFMSLLISIGLSPIFVWYGF